MIKIIEEEQIEMSFSKDRWANRSLGTFLKDKKKEKQGRKVCGLLSEGLGVYLLL